MTEVSVSVRGTDFLLSMVEEQWASRNGNTMELVPKAQQELAKIEEQIATLQALPGQTDEIQRQVEELSGRIEALREEMNGFHNTWRRIELARHPQRPYTLDYVERIFTDWSELHGDRGFADDAAIVGGLARFHGEEVMLIGHQKARETKQKIYRNFGMPNPEGYRKALRLMHIAEKFNRPIITLVDTTGAYPGLGAEERGQAEAIARNLREMARLKVPIITVIIGEGGSGGALAIAIADRVLMLENAIYSVISPESCAAIMWRDVAKKELAAEALRITAQDVIELGCVDGIIPEPEGGAQTDHEGAAALLDAALQEHLANLKAISLPQLLTSRYEKFRNMAQFFQMQD